MSNQIFIQVRIKEQTEVGEYNDAIYFTEEEYAQGVDKQIEEEKNRRIAQWVESVKNPPLPPEPTKEDLEAEAQAILDQKASLDARLSEIQASVVAIDSILLDAEPVGKVNG